jgi:hypothetical protein
MTYAERFEASRCKELAHILKTNKPAFDKVLTEAIGRQRPLAEALKIDSGIAEVLAIITLLAEPLTYLNFLDDANRKRIRNAWDRLDRRKNKPERMALFRQILRRGSTRKPRKVFVPPSGEILDRLRRLDDCRRAQLTWLSFVPWGQRHGDNEHRTRNPLLDREKFVANFRETLLPPMPGTDVVFEDGKECSIPVVLGCDLDSTRKVLYRSSASKLKQAAHKHKLYSE